MDIQVYFADDNVSADSPTVDDDSDPATPEVPNAAFDGIHFFDGTDESSQYGSNDWTQRVKGVTYDLDMQLVGKGFGTYYWQVTANDRVGNMATTDSDEEEKGNQPFSFKVDDADPKVDLARTGIGYEAEEGEFKDRSWIALAFINGEGAAERRRPHRRLHRPALRLHGGRPHGHGRPRPE